MKAFVSRFRSVKAKATLNFKAPVECSLCYFGIDPRDVELRRFDKRGHTCNNICNDCFSRQCAIKFDNGDRFCSFGLNCPFCPSYVLWEDLLKTLTFAPRITQYSKDTIEGAMIRNYLFCQSNFSLCSECTNGALFDCKVTGWKCQQCKLRCVYCKSLLSWSHICINRFKSGFWTIFMFFYAALAWNLTFCPNCDIIIERTRGCSHMKCKCGANFCFYCLQDCRGPCCSPKQALRRKLYLSLTVVILIWIAL